MIRNHARAWILGLLSAASIITGWALAAHGAVLEGSTGGGGPCELWGVFFIALPFLVAIGAAALWLLGEAARDVRTYKAWKATLTPQERTAVNAAETAALWAAWAGVHHWVKEGREKEAARVAERNGDRARQAGYRQHLADMDQKLRDENFYG